MANEALTLQQGGGVSKSVAAGIYSLGYVGLPLALHFCAVGIKIISFDIDSHKTDTLNTGRSYMERLTPELIQTACRQAVEATTDFARTPQVYVLAIYVPTPLGAHRLCEHVGTSRRMMRHEWQTLDHDRACTAVIGRIKALQIFLPDTV